MRVDWKVRVKTRKEKGRKTSTILESPRLIQLPWRYCQYGVTAKCSTVLHSSVNVALRLIRTSAAFGDDLSRVYSLSKETGNLHVLAPRDFDDDEVEEDLSLTDYFPLIVEVGSIQDLWQSVLFDSRYLVYTQSFIIIDLELIFQWRLFRHEPLGQTLGGFQSDYFDKSRAHSIVACEEPISIWTPRYRCP